MTSNVKLNIGAGSDIRKNYINHDITILDGIDIVHDLNVYPWPWKDSSLEEVVMKDVVEHLDNFMKAMEELYRIMKPGGVVKVSVPYWNSSFAHIDPTHRRGFHEHTFKFFDPDSIYCQERHYYTHARFKIIKEVFVISPFSPYIQIPGLRLVRIRNKYFKKVVGLLGNMFSNFIFLSYYYE